MVGSYSKGLALPWVGFSAHPSTTRAPVRAQLWVHALRGVYSELRAGGGTRNGRLRRNSYLGQRKTFFFPRQVGVVWRQRRGRALCFLLLRLLHGRVWEINDPHVQCWITVLGKRPPKCRRRESQVFFQEGGCPAAAECVDL